MADTAVAITAGSGTNVDTRTEATNGNHRQVVVLGDPSTNAGVAPVDATTGLSVNVTNSSLTVGTHAVTQSGTWTVQPGNTANTTAWKVDGSAVTQPVSLASVPSHAVTNAGTFATQVDGAALTALQLIDDPVATLGTTTYTEASTKGMIVGAVRRDADTTLVDTTNELGPLQMDANGRLKVEAFSGETLPVSYATTGSGTATGALRVELPTNGTGVLATVGAVTAITNALPAGTNAIGKLAANSGIDIGDVDVVTCGTITPGTAATSLGKAIDSAVGATDTGVAILAQRKDTLATHTPADGDYVPLRVSATGALHVTGSSGGGTEYTEDAAAASDPVGTMIMGVRRDTLSTSEVSADGDNIALKATNKGKLHVAAELRFGDTVADTGTGTGGSATQRVVVDSSQLASLGAAASSASQPVVLASDQKFFANAYETVAASQTAQALGATGATGDYIAGVLVVPATTSPGVVTLLDNATSISVFAGGASSVSNLVPFYIPLGMVSVSGAWKLTTGANVSCIGIGKFT